MIKECSWLLPWLDQVVWTEWEWDTLFLRKVLIMASRVMLYPVRVSAYCRQYIGACELNYSFSQWKIGMIRYDTIRYDRQPAACCCRRY